MAITVKGVEVRTKEVRTNVRVEFDDLTEEGQKRIFLENKEEFIVEALKSRYGSVVELVWEVKDECSSVALNAAIAECIKKGASEERILDLLNVPGFELDKKLRKILAISVRSLPIQIWVAKDEKTSFKLLRKMFYNATVKLVRDNDPQLFDAIVTNPNFKSDEEVMAQIIHSSAKIKERIENVISISCAEEIKSKELPN